LTGRLLPNERTVLWIKNDSQGECADAHGEDRGRVRTDGDRPLRLFQGRRSPRPQKRMPLLSLTREYRYQCPKKINEIILKFFKKNLKRVNAG